MDSIQTRAALAIAIAILAGCATARSDTTSVTIAEPFDEASAIAQMKAGTSSLKGSALLRKQNGGVVTCAGFEAMLVPATAYARARVRAIYGNESGGLNSADARRNPTFTPNPPAYSQLTQKTGCDAQGSFAFKSITGGDFYVVAPVIWKTSSGEQGGILSKLVTLREGEAKEIVLTQ
jgi:hypothetical protein